jgi:hypothetical protein
MSQLSSLAFMTGERLVSAARLDQPLGIALDHREAGFAYLTPARGAMITPMAPLALRDREAGTVTVTTSQAMWKKPDRIRRHHGVAIVYHAPDHGLTRRSGFVLVQGRASSVRTEWSTRRTQRPAIGSRAPKSSSSL